MVSAVRALFGRLLVLVLRWRAETSLVAAFFSVRLREVLRLRTGQPVSRPMLRRLLVLLSASQLCVVSPGGAAEAPLEDTRPVVAGRVALRWGAGRDARRAAVAEFCREREREPWECRLGAVSRCARAVLDPVPSAAFTSHRALCRLCAADAGRLVRAPTLTHTIAEGIQLLCKSKRR